MKCDKQHAQLEELKIIEKDIKGKVRECADYAQNSNEPSLDELYTDVYK